MRSNRIISTLVALAMIISITACNIPGATNSGTTASTLDPAAVDMAAGTIVAQTLTASALLISPTPQPPADTATPTQTETNAATATSQAITYQVTKDTYCREGAPVAAFKSVVIIKSGQMVEVLARDPEGNSYFVKNPYQENSTCWIFGKDITLSGNAAGLDIATLQPTPTPTRTPTPNIGFTLTYSSLVSCGATYTFKLYIQNTSAAAMQYISITGSDSVTGTSINHTSNVFDQYSGCSVVNPQDSIAAGDDTYAMNLNPGELGYNPTGHLINLSVKLCTENDAQGLCVTKPISFTP